MERFTQHSIVNAVPAGSANDEDFGVYAPVIFEDEAPVPSKYIEPVPYFTCDVLIFAVDGVKRLFFLVLSIIPPLVKSQSKAT